MAIYNLDGDKEYATISLGGEIWNVGEFGEKKKKKIKKKISELDDDISVEGLRSFWGEIANDILPLYNSSYTSDVFDKAGDTEVGVFAFLVAEFVGGE